MKISRKTICALAFILSIPSLTIYVVASRYYFYTSQSIPVGLVILPSSDLNQDGIVDVNDLKIVATAFGSQLGTPNWNPIADLNRDNIVDVFDVFIVAEDYGRSI